MSDTNTLKHLTLHEKSWSWKKSCLHDWQNVTFSVVDCVRHLHNINNATTLCIPSNYTEVNHNKNNNTTNNSIITIWLRRSTVAPICRGSASRTDVNIFSCCKRLEENFLKNLGRWTNRHGPMLPLWLVLIAGCKSSTQTHLKTNYKRQSSNSINLPFTNSIKYQQFHGSGADNKMDFITLRCYGWNMKWEI